MGSSNLDIGAVLRDPDFLGLSTIEKRKFLMDADPDFRSLPVAEQSKFIISLVSPQFEEPQPSVWEAQGVGGPVGAIAARAGKQIFEDIKEQGTPTLESFSGPVGTPLRAAVESGQFLRRAFKQPLGETAKQFALSPIPIPVEKLGTQIGTGKIPEALGTAALTGAEFAGLAGAGKLQQARGLKAKPPEPVIINEQLGQAMQSYLKKARKDGIGKEIGKHVDNIVDAASDPVRYPIPPIDAASKIGALKEGFAAYDKTLTDMNLKPDAVIRKTVEEAIQSPRWTWAQAKDVRTALMDMQRKAGKRMSGAVSKAIGELTDDMRRVAKESGVEADFDAYNTLTRQAAYIDRQFLDSILKAKSGTDVMNALTGTKEGPVKMNLPALKAYGVDPAVVSDAIAFSKRLKGKEGWIGGWSPRSVGAHAAMALGIPYSAGWFGVEAIQQAIKRRGTSPVGGAGTALVEGERIAKGRMPIPPSKVATPTEVPVEPYPPTGIAGESRQRLLPPVPKVGAAPEAAPPEVPQTLPQDILPKPTAFQREIAKRDALLDLRKNLRTPSAQARAWLESKGVDFEKPGALAEAHRVINEELAALTGKGKKAATKKEPLPPVPKKKSGTK